MTTTVSLSVAALTIDSADPAALADFWGKALGRPVSPGAVAGDTAVDATDPASGPRMLLRNVPEPKGIASCPAHRALRRGDRAADRPGRQAAQRDQAPGGPLGRGLYMVRQTTFADPEGNEFDLVMWQQQPE